MYSGDMAIIVGLGKITPNQPSGTKSEDEMQAGLMLGFKR